MQSIALFLPFNFKHSSQHLVLKTLNMKGKVINTKDGVENSHNYKASKAIPVTGL
jgi:hypothetical protein